MQFRIFVRGEGEGLPKDFPAKEIGALEETCFDTPWKEEDIVNLWRNDPFIRFVVAYDEEKVIAYLSYDETFDSATIDRLCVNPSYRRKGLALELLKAMENSLIEGGEVLALTLEVRKGNLPAVSLYKKAGYEERSIKKGYYQDGEDALYMVKYVDYPRD